jgi:hypothetical protein
MKMAPIIIVLLTWVVVAAAAEQKGVRADIKLFLPTPLIFSASYTILVINRTDCLLPLSSHIIIIG